MRCIDSSETALFVIVVVLVLVVLVVIVVVIVQHQRPQYADVPTVTPFL